MSHILKLAVINCLISERWLGYGYPPGYVFVKIWSTRWERRLTMWRDPRKTKAGKYVKWAWYVTDFGTHYHVGRANNIDHSNFKKGGAVTRRGLEIRYNRRDGHFKHTNRKIAQAHSWDLVCFPRWEWPNRPSKFQWTSSTHKATSTKLSYVSLTGMPRKEHQRDLEAASCCGEPIEIYASK